MEMCFGTLAAVGDTSEEVTLLSETGGAGRGGAGREVKIQIFHFHMLVIY